MELHAAELLAKTIMRDHGLFDNPQPDGGFPWVMVWNRTKGKAGICNHTGRKIILSKVITEVHDEATVTDTVLHEVAHALVGPDHGHDEVWVTKCLELGGNGKATYDASEVGSVTPAWYSICPTCSNVANHQHRAPLRVRSCGTCSPGNFDHTKLVNWYHFDVKQEVGNMTKRFRDEWNLLASRYGFTSATDLTGYTAPVDEVTTVDEVAPVDSAPVTTETLVDAGLVEIVPVSLVKVVETVVEPVKVAKPRATRKPKVAATV